MKIIVLGSGVIGVTTAYLLAARGHTVEVIERKSECAAETSFANGGQLSYSHAEPWANPSVLPKVFKWMFKDDAPLVLRPRLDYRMMKWGLQFLSNCTTRAAERNAITLLRLGIYSKRKFEQVCSYTGIEFDRRMDGILHVFDDRKELDHAIAQAHFQEKFGCKEEVLTLDQCLRLEPSLQYSGKKLVGGIHAPLDESGDAREFASKLSDLCEKEYGVVFHYNTEITGIQREKKRIVAIQTSAGDFTADAYVLSLGSYSSIHLRKLGIDVPIYPMKGYSLTMPANMFAPKVSITDQQAKIVYSRLGDELRVAGTAEFAGYSDKVNEKRILPILNAIKNLFPRVVPEDESQISRWACLRPSTPDGPPIIGKTPYENLYLNTGHGTLGWTQAAGSAFLLADVVDGKQPEISLEGLSLDRYL
jgi:D-amino-acid dehydrogenase